MAALDEPVDNVSDRRLRAAIVAVSGGHPDAVALTARMLNPHVRSEDAGKVSAPVAPPRPRR